MRTGNRWNRFWEILLNVFLIIIIYIVLPIMLIICPSVLVVFYIIGIVKCKEMQTTIGLACMLILVVVLEIYFWYKLFKVADKDEEQDISGSS
jgi:hypothetical protein